MLSSSIIPKLAAVNEHGSFVHYLPVIGALIALTGALSVTAWTQYQNRRDRRRDLYSAAYKAVVAWTEMPYRVRRRDPDKTYELVELFHSLQESVNYHDGWISIESPDLAKAYREFASVVKTKTGPAIKRAWANSPCDPQDGFSPPNGEHQPEVESEKRQFLADVNDHLSLSYNRRQALKRRYPKPRRSTT